ncbi:MAG: hypothetical protein LBG15_13325 [Dysgonamonadaceae bacterium]|nr:hypothetical protein [Dysgonamonadaceae bacterium]
MLEDEKVLKSFVSAAIKKEVLTLDKNSFYCNFRNCEGKQLEEQDPVYWLYSNANIVDDDGSEKNVVIEVKKSKFNSDILRFRDRHRCRRPGSYTKTWPIYTIMIIEDGIDAPESPLLVSSYVIEDVISNTTLPSAPLLDLMPDLNDIKWIFQICYIEQNSSEIERLMSLFKRENGYVIDVNEEDFPESYRSVLQRLHAALENENVRSEMEKE